jgi:hypothetical protein
MLDIGLHLFRPFGVLIGQLRQLLHVNRGADLLGRVGHHRGKGRTVDLGELIAAPFVSFALTMKTILRQNDRGSQVYNSQTD